MFWWRQMMEKQELCQYADDGNLETACLEALEQIETNNYEEVLQDDRVENIIKYGIAFYKKKCRVKIKK